MNKSKIKIIKTKKNYLANSNGLGREIVQNLEFKHRSSLRVRIS